MDKKEEFKNFVKEHPELINFVKNKKMTWQDFYEIYDIYGNDDSAWTRYFEVEERTGKISELTNIFKNINFDNIEHHINNAQKAIGIIQELTKKTPEEVIDIVDTPITDLYGD